MVGLVLVSHSKALADALSQLVAQVTQSRVAVAVAAGIGLDRQEIGTDATDILAAILSVSSGDGVAVLMDLGSAVLSADLARELLPAEVQGQVRFCAAPFVEGAIAAAAQAGVGSDLEAVCKEAEAALLPKLEQLGGPAEPGSQLIAEPAAAEQAQEIVLTLHNQHGLHARPAARFVQTAASFEADVRVWNLTNGKGPVSARSLNGVATLGALENHQVRVTAIGAQAAQVLQALSDLVADNFGERPASATQAAGPIEKLSAAVQTASRSSVLDGMSAAPDELGVPISEGVALAPFFRYQPTPPPVSTDSVPDPAPEWERLQRALSSAALDIRQRRLTMTRALGEEQAAIFDAHALILQDPDLLDETHRLIFERRQNAAWAWHTAISRTAEAYHNLDDPYLQQRAADVLDVGNQVLFALEEKSGAVSLHFPEPVILFAEELTPTETAQLEMDQVLGLVTVGGGPTSHSAILARGLGIPAVSGASPALADLAAGTLVGLDGFNGALWINPGAKVQIELKSRRTTWLEQRQALLQKSQQSAVTRDGRRVEVAANVGKLQDAQAAVTNGAEGVGLLRTEFLFITRTTPPTEDEQLDSLLQIGQALQGRPLVVRTLDVGGDKEVPYIHLPPEANPFLGVRALRISLRSPELFLPQLRAILRAGAQFPFRVMFPMVANLDEVLQARQMLGQAHTQLEEAGLPHRWPIETGIMVEIPAAALLSRVLAPQIDFFSIGTNDLTQYTLAAERGNPALSGLADALHPAVLGLIGQVVEGAHAYGKWVGVCGELAGDALATPVLAGLGVDELSMNPGSIPRVKAVLRAISMPEARDLAARVLLASGAPEARQLAREFAAQLAI